MDLIPNRSQDTIAPGYPYFAGMQAPGTFPIPGGFHIEGAKQQIFAAMRGRTSTDVNIPLMWYLLPILAAIIGAVVVTAIAVYEIFVSGILDWPVGYVPTSAQIFGAIGWTLVTSIIVAIIVVVLFAILTHMMVERLNNHYARETHLRMGIISFVRAAAGSPEKEAMIASEIATMNMIQSEASRDEQQHTSILWALLIVFGWILPIVYEILLAYMFYFLMRPVFRHDRRWYDFLAQANSALGKLGYKVQPQYGPRPLPDRSYVIYIVLTIVTFGLFGLYWWYVLVDDPNEHFRNQAYLEDSLANAIAQK